MRILTTLILCILTQLSVANGKYEAAMSKNIPGMFRAENPETLTQVINQLVRVGEAEKDKWEPYYYAAFGYVRLMQMSTEKAEKDRHLDQALVLIDKGEAILGIDSELVSLRGFVHMMRLTVEPETRGQEYSGLAFTEFNKAVQLNPQNPRAHYLLGQMQLGTAQFFGGGDGGSCDTFRTALELFESDQPDSPFAPSWGKDGVTQALKTCN